MKPQYDFRAQLGAYKQAVDEQIAAYTARAQKQTERQYGEYPALVYDTYLDILSRGGKRIRGALAMAGYEMAGGANRQMIVQAAMGIEMLHAYILILDDIQDRSSKRRGKPSAHDLLTTYHRKHDLRGDAPHAGMSLALNAAWAGSHAAQNIFLDLPVAPEVRIRALQLLNEHIIVTAHGQTIDIMNELTEEVSTAQIDQVLEWKTAAYTVLNPLQVGMTLAGASPESIQAIAGYAIPAGKAFQIADDILGVFGNEEKSGKSPMDDIREGKRTVLTAYALAHATPEDQVFLRHALGNANLATKDFEQCKAILQASGAHQHASQQAEMYVSQAIAALEAEDGHWDARGVAFLRDLAHALANRAA